MRQPGDDHDYPDDHSGSDERGDVPERMPSSNVDADGEDLHIHPFIIYTLDITEFVSLSTMFTD